MADLTKNLYLDQAGLETLVTEIKEADAKVLSDSKAYTDEQIETCDPAGSSATVQENLDKEVERAQSAEKANTDAITALAEKVGEVPEDSTVMDVIENIQKNAYDDTGLRNLISGVQGEVDALEQTHATDKATLEKAVTDEETRAKGIESGLETRLATVEGDYLKKADKDELATDIKENTDAIGVLNGDSSVEGSVDKKVADAINTFATQISDDGTINTYKEILNYISTHGGEAAEMASAIDALETLVGSKSVATQIAEAITAENLAQYATDEELADAIARIVVLEGKSHEHENAEELAKITDGDVAKWNATEQNAKDYTDTLNVTMDTRVKEVEASLAEGGVTATAIANVASAVATAQSEVDALEQTHATDKAALEAADTAMDERIVALESVTYEAIPTETITGLFT